MHRNTQLLCCVMGANILGQLYFKNEDANKLIRRSDLWLQEVRNGGGKWDESSPNVQTSSYKLSIRDVMYNMVHVIIVAVYLCVKFFKRLRVFITKKIFFLF